MGGKTPSTAGGSGTQRLVGLHTLGWGAGQTWMGHAAARQGRCLAMHLAWLGAVGGGGCGSLRRCRRRSSGHLVPCGVSRPFPFSVPLGVRRLSPARPLPQVTSARHSRLEPGQCGRARSPAWPSSAIAAVCGAVALQPHPVCLGSLRGACSWIDIGCSWGGVN